MKSLYLILIVAIVGMISCSDSFTDLAPISQRNVDNFYNTEGDMEVAVNAIYNTLKEIGTYNGSYWVFQELRSVNTFWDGTGLAEAVTVFDKFTDISTSGVTESAWNDTYLGISRANIVLGFIGGVEMDASVKDQFIGEALFMRALYYYHLAVGFGNIPLILDIPESVAEGNEHRQVDAGTVYAQLIEDLKDAESKLPQSYGGADVGRATKGAAATLLGRIYLTTGDKTSAAAALTRVMGMGYELVPEFEDLWKLDNENNIESIFEVQFEGGFGNQGNAFTSQFNGDLAGSVT